MAVLAAERKTKPANTCTDYSRHHKAALMVRVPAGLLGALLKFGAGLVRTMHITYYIILNIIIILFYSILFYIIYV
jgi:hypothetical protein